MEANSPLILDATQVLERLKDLDVMKTMRKLFQALGEGQAIQPPQAVTLFPGGKGDFITYSGVLAGEMVFGLKVSPYLKTEGRPIVTAYTLLMSMETGQPVMLCDSFALTVERTAATTALAVDLLAKTDARRLAVIGSGPVALAHLKYALPLRHWDHISISSLDLPQNSDAIKPRLRELGIDVEIAEDQMFATEDADVVMLCTSSGTPVLDPRDLGKPALVTSISTNVLNAHEIPPIALKEMDVYCDYRATTPATAGEMVIAQEDGWSIHSVRGDLGELVSGKAPLPDYAHHCFFRSVGLGLEDVQLALAIQKHV